MIRNNNVLLSAVTFVVFVILKCGNFYLHQFVFDKEEKKTPPVDQVDEESKKVENGELPKDKGKEIVEGKEEVITEESKEEALEKGKGKEKETEIKVSPSSASTSETKV